MSVAVAQRVPILIVDATGFGATDTRAQWSLYCGTPENIICARAGAIDSPFNRDLPIIVHTSNVAVSTLADIVLPRLERGKTSTPGSVLFELVRPLSKSE